MHVRRGANQIWFIAFTAIACITGCAGPSAKTQVPGVTNPAVDALHRRVRADGSVSFRSYNGKAYRMDSDTELTFYPDGKACMLDWGFSGEEIWGNYRICSEGWLICWFKDYRTEWPAMELAVEGAELLLRPLNPPNGLTPQQPGDAAKPPDQQYWRFRSLSGDDAREVLKTIEAWRHHAAS